MATFKFYKDQASPGVYYPPGYAPFKRTVDMPTIIAGGERGGLATTLDVRTPAPATGLAIADVLQVFQVSLGFCLRLVGMNVKVQNAGACTIALGNASATATHRKAASTAGYMAAVATNATGVSITLVNAAHLGPDVYTGVVFVQNSSIDALLAGAVWLAGVIDFWAMGDMCF